MTFYNMKLFRWVFEHEKDFWLCQFLAGIIVIMSLNWSADMPLW